ncbi:aldehyde ferredoxin oxidoreductase family protein [Halovivax gelatinilyticus]|uniref:aldehyde ferredoxin oxidoreductase family protein n=1 Tax=Halovivax gelatinilyticus TaxID=2961597 RepID=UPI0020CA27B4|nr:aldehyde ferredoxin oxidoreductase C-terminal domain-containing protein [Halovivax gelatinilyticus]
MAPRAPDRIVRVDLTDERVESEPVPERWRRLYVGGKGLGARYLFDELEPGVDPLGAKNVLGFVLGPLSGYLPGDGRYAAITKSPLTGTFLDSYAGGEFPAALAGSLGDHIGILVTGRASRPVRLDVANGSVSIEPAESWGEDTVETDRRHPDASVACIGPAGEHEVSFATIASDEATHHAGRGGAGAVMGSKRLKAVVARDDPPTPDSVLARLRARATDRYRESETGIWQSTSETVETVDFANEAGVLSSYGWRERGFDDTESVGIEAARDVATGRERDGPIPGGFRVDTDEGETVPRGATAMTLGAGLGIDDFEEISRLGHRCNRLGVDLIEAGNAIAWAIRAADDGFLDRDLSFGSPSDARDLLFEIGNRSSPLGEALAAGIDVAAERYGGDQFIPSVKRQSLPAYDPRATSSMALAYATSDRGGCHRRARPIERAVFEADWDATRTVDAIVRAQNERSLRWSLVADDFVGESIDAAEWLDAVGVPYHDLDSTGERIWNLVRLFNVREGFDRRDDAFPSELVDGTVDQDAFESLLDTYYVQRGWDRSGCPTEQTLSALDLDSFVDDSLGAKDSTVDE